MSTKIVLREGVATAVYDDWLLPYFQAWGKVTITRASDLEWDSEAQEWVATLTEHGAKKTGGVVGQEIARGTCRELVNKAEVAWIEERL